MKRFLFDPGFHSVYTSLALLIVRLTAGGMMLLGHGWAKITDRGEMVATFPNPLGFGAHASLSLVIFAEVFCSALIILGLLTRFAAVPLAFTMFVALFLIHGGDGLARQELPALYLIIFGLLFATGGGRYSLDSLISRRSVSPQDLPPTGTSSTGATPSSSENL